MGLTRREWSITGFAGSAIPQSFALSVQTPVVIGLQTYSLRDRSLEEAIKAMVQLHI